MKYQDLCIRLSEILRARGINTIYFEDVNLLNSEDVVYPAAVVQLVRVEQETQSDRYTIMLTIASKHIGQTNTGKVSDDIVVRPNINEIFPNGHYEVVAEYYHFSNIKDASFVLGKKKLIGNCPISVNLLPSEYRRDSTNLLLMYNEGQPKNPPNRVMNSIHEQAYAVQGNEAYYSVVFRLKTQYYNLEDFEEVCKYSTITFHGAAATNSYYYNIPTFNIRGITDILAEDEHIQINSCVTTPFRWKFRDECEGITAEINLSLFFDSRCN